MSVNQNMGIDVWNGPEVEAGQVDEEQVVNKWLNRRYEHPVLRDQVEDTGFGATKVALNYDPVESALEPGIAGKLLCNPTDPQASRLYLG